MFIKLFIFTFVESSSEENKGLTTPPSLLVFLIYLILSSDFDCFVILDISVCRNIGACGSMDIIDAC